MTARTSNPTTSASPDGGQARWPAHQRALVVAFVATVALFGACTAFVELGARDATERVEALASVRLPAIAHLTATRAEVRDIETMLSDAVDGQPWGRGALQRARASLISDWRQCAGSGDEPELARAASALDAFEASVDQVRALLAAGDAPDARAALETRLVRDSEAADRALSALIEVQTNAARAAAARTVERGRRAMRVALVLDGASIALAAALAILAIRATRRGSRVLEERASELGLFADRVAHDIGGALTTTLLALERGERDTRGDERQHRNMERGLRGVRAVRDILRDLHAFAQSGAAPDPLARADVRAVVTGVVEELAPLAEKHHVELAAEPIEALDVRAGSGILASIVSNLVRNAILHMGDAARRRVVVRARAGADVRLEVEDTGPGIPPQLAERLFEPRVRGPTRAQGLGLGLATVRRLADAHGGSAGVDARPGGGSTFWVHLPRADGADEP